MFTQVDRCFAFAGWWRFGLSAPRTQWPPIGVTPRLAAILVFLLNHCLVGCGSTRWTDTSRTATEQLVVSHAMDQAVSQVDFSILSGKTVFFDPQYLDGVTDRGYLASSLRQHLLASGCLLMEDRAKAEIVVEARCGGAGTDRHDQLLLGIPQMTLPSVQPGVPTATPEIPLVKKTNQVAAAKVAVFAFNRTTGEPVWQSGIAQYGSSAKNYWVFGAGPFEGGRSRRRTTYGGEELSIASDGSVRPKNQYADDSLAVAKPMVWLNKPVSDIQTASATLPAVGPKSPATPPPPTPPAQTILLPASTDLK